MNRLLPLAIISVCLWSSASRWTLLLSAQSPAAANTPDCLIAPPNALRHRIALWMKGSEPARTVPAGQPNPFKIDMAGIKCYKHLVQILVEQVGRLWCWWSHHTNLWQTYWHRIAVAHNARHRLTDYYAGIEQSGAVHMYLKTFAVRCLTHLSNG